MLGRESWTLTLDQRCLYTLEVEGGGTPYMQTILDVCNDAKRLEPTYLLLWALTAGHRDKSRIHYAVSEHEKAKGYQVPPAFVAALPFGDSWKELQMAVLEMIMASGLVSYPGSGQKSAPPIEYEPDEQPPLDPP